jgi:hypothetical protein
MKTRRKNALCGALWSEIPKPPWFAAARQLRFHLQIKQYSVMWSQLTLPRGSVDYTTHGSRILSVSFKIQRWKIGGRRDAGPSLRGELANQLVSMLFTAHRPHLSFARSIGPDSFVAAKVTDLWKPGLRMARVSIEVSLRR